MKNKLHKFTSVLLLLTLVCSMFTTLPTTVFAAEVDNSNISANTDTDKVLTNTDDDSDSSTEVFTSGDYKYTKNDDGTVTISGYNGSDAELEIPGSIDGYTVTAIGDRAFEVNYANSVIIPGSVKSIGYQAFYNSTLNSLIIENGSASSVSIGDRAFAFCWRLKSVTLSDNVISIGNYAFGSAPLESIHIPDGLVTIGDYAFYSTKLKSIIIPASVELIGECAFNGSDSSYSEFENITFLEGGTSKLTIKRAAFSCGNYKNLVFPDREIELGESAFSALNYLQSIEFKGGKITLGEHVFERSSVENLVFSPNCTVSIDYRAFEKCVNLENIIFPKNVTKLGENAFSECKSLKSVTIPSSVKKIYSYAFEECKSLKSVVIEDGVKVIGRNAFNWCESLESVTLPDSIEIIEESAFCSTNIPDSVTKIDGLVGLRAIACNRGSYAHRYAIEETEKSDSPDMRIYYKILDAISGDTNLDGKVDIKDATRLQMAIGGALDNELEYTLMSNFNDVADLNKDGNADVSDVTLIQKMIAGYAAK